MNFLAHIHLSFGDHELALGNFIADSVKGDGLDHHTPRIKSGIALHREIDDFTDHHDIVRQSRSRLFEKYSHYSAVLVDIFYDHFLARSWEDWHHEPLDNFAQRHYQFFESRKEDLTPQTAHMLPYMKRYDWLTNYANYDGMQRVLNGMSRRASFQSKMEKAVKDLIELDREFSSDFEAFYPELIEHVRQITPTIIAKE